MPDTKVYLDQNYPSYRRGIVSKLNLKSKNLQGHLDLSDFVNLKELDCSDNQLTSLDISKNTKLEVIICNYNKIKADIYIFAYLVNLKKLVLGPEIEEFTRRTENPEPFPKGLYKLNDNFFYGTLYLLYRCENLEYINIVCQEQINHHPYFLAKSNQFKKLKYLVNSGTFFHRKMERRSYNFKHYRFSRQLKELEKNLRKQNENGELILPENTSLDSFIRKAIEAEEKKYKYEHGESCFDSLPTSYSKNSKTELESSKKNILDSCPWISLLRVYDINIYHFLARRQFYRQNKLPSETNDMIEEFVLADLSVFANLCKIHEELLPTNFPLIYSEPIKDEEKLELILLKFNPKDIIFLERNIFTPIKLEVELIVDYHQRFLNFVASEGKKYNKLVDLSSFLFSERLKKVFGTNIITNPQQYKLLTNTLIKNSYALEPTQERWNIFADQLKSELEQWRNQAIIQILDWDFNQEKAKLDKELEERILKLKSKDEPKVTTEEKEEGETKEVTQMEEKTSQLEPTKTEETSQNSPFPKWACLFLIFPLFWLGKHFFFSNPEPSSTQLETKPEPVPNPKSKSKKLKRKTIK